ncbi:MAG: DUF3800 domain-containing protein [Hyphomonadaceae bacterium]|nr:DUF3800 domain-containing protein [Hyphomonadaceae bacterium]
MCDMTNPAESGDGLSRAAWRVRAEVSGLPPGVWERRPFVILQFFADDSGNAPNQDTMALGGLVAPAAKWVEFTMGWEALLKGTPSAEYFKFSQAYRMRGEFDERGGWSEEERNSRVERMSQLVADTATAWCFVTMRHEDFETYLRNQPVPFRSFLSDHPYLLMFGRLMAALAVRLSAERLSDPCQVYMDTQHGQDAFVRTLLWPSIIQTLVETPPTLIPADAIKPKFSDAPRFESDREFLPLQAADLIAGATRMGAMEGSIPAYMAPILKIPRNGFEMSSDDVRVMGERLRLTIEEAKRAFPDMPLYPPGKR